MARKATTRAKVPSPGFVGERARYVLAPGLKRLRRDGRTIVQNVQLGEEYEATPAVDRVLELFVSPRTFVDLVKGSGRSRSELRPLFEALVRAFVLVRDDDCSWLARGLVVRPARPCGTPARLGRLQPPSPSAFAVLGVPVDLAGSARAGAGPAEIRAHIPPRLFPRADDAAHDRVPERFLDMAMRREYRARDLPRVVDFGDVVHAPGEGFQEVRARIRSVLDRIRETGACPVVLGGDHSITWAVLEHLLERGERFGIVHFDAHHDLHGGSSPKWLSHNNPFVFALQHPGVVDLFQIGLRTRFNAIYSDEVVRRDKRVRYLSAMEAASRSPEQVFRALRKDVPYYLSFDIDCVDPSVAPETGTPVIGGMSYPQVLALIDHVATRFRFLGADFMEVASGHANAAAQITASLVTQFMVAKAPWRPLRSFAGTEPRRGARAKKR